ncbi:MAG: zf-HC2 domain-containing protein [Candidatus Aminicenantes bacterium]|nr:zf-HC2 domain-containing protein [Candidatus Aminicenantes bacterium]
MKCKKVQRYLPLVVGSDISKSKISEVKAHVEKCPECRHEYDSYVLSLGKTKEWLAKEREDWEDREWQQVVKIAIGDKEPELSPLAPWPFRKVWAYVMMAVFAVVFTFFVIRPGFYKEGVIPGTRMVAESQAKLFESFKDKPEQDIISMTMVSKDTGLKIVWFFNKNFDLEDKK